jgi:deoxyribonuclease I
MRYSVLLFSFLFAVSAFAQTNRKLANGQLAYYGAEFYSQKITKDSLYKILNEQHTIVANAHDQIQSGCQTQSQTTCFRHTSVGYDGARKIMFGELFIKKDGGGTFVQDVYCGKKFYFRHLNEVGGMHTEVNIEHTWPQSKFNGNFDKNMQKSDMHHLYLTDSMANNRRANHEFGEIGDRHDELNVQNCAPSRLGEISGHFVFTPPKAHRGNVARSLFYFAVRYKIFIGPAEEMILRQWHTMDPVDAEEIARHELIAKYQKVRNPFVDFPQLVEKLADF